MRIQYLGHSCFKISSGGYALVVDPYENGSVPGPVSYTHLVTGAM